MSKIVQHPFGRENEVSLQQLLQSFCNHLYLGQWESARACIGELNDQRELANENIISLIEDCIQSPYNKSIGLSNDEVFSPHHLSWLCCKEYENFMGIQNSEFQKTFPEILKKVEFQLLLCQLTEYIKVNEIRELYSYYTNSSKTTDSTNNFSHKCLQSLQHSLLNKPATTHALLSQLIDVHSSEHHIHCFYNIYIQCLQALTDDLKHFKSENECQELQYTSDELKQKTYIFCELLSLFDPPISIVHALNVPLENIFNDIIELAHTKAPSVISTESLYSALLGRESNHLLEHFNSVQCQWMKNLAISNCTIKPGTDFSEDDCYILGLAHILDRDIMWKQLLFLCLQRKRHFVDTILELSVKLVVKNEFSELEVLLHVPELSPLYPLVLLIGWDHCRNTEEAVKLVQAVLLHSQESHTQGQKCLNKSVHDACDRLQSKSRDLDKFVQNYRTLLPHETLNEQCMKYMLKSGLQIEGTLYMLYKYTKISTLPQDLLLQLIGELSNDKSKVDQIDQSANDTAIYLAFCAVKDFITALTKSAGMVHWMTSATANNAGTENQSDLPFPPFRASSVAVSTSSTAEIEDLQVSYTDTVLRLLEHVKQTVEKIYPLNYRTEILEDLFSLLFLRSDDMPNCSEVESGEEGGKEWESSTGQNTPNVGTPLTPVQLTPAKLEEHQNMANRELKKKHVTTDLFTRFIEDVQQPLDAAAIASVFQNSGHSNETDTTEVATSMVITQESLKDGDSTECDSKLKQACHFSTGSNTSSFNTSKIGFIANDFFVRDALLILKQCLEKLNSEYQNIDLTSQSQDGKNSGLQCSTSMNEVKSHIVRLTQCVSEGLWRFQLVAHQFVPFEYGKILGDVSNHEHDYISDDEDIMLSEDEETSSSAETVKKRRKRQSDSQSGTESHVTTDGSQSARSSSSKKQLTRRSRSQRRLRRRAGKREYMKGVLDGKKGIVSRLLSDRNTLLTMCLRRGKVSQASQVVKLCGLEETPEEAEVLFAENFKLAVNKVLSHDSKIQHSNRLATQDKLSIKRASGLSLGSKTVLSNIASIAAKGMASLSVANIAEHLLGLTVQPALVSKHAKSLVHKSTIKHLVSEDLVPTMVVLDLACSSSNVWDSANILLDLALKRLPSHMKSNVVTTQEKDHPQCTTSTNKTSNQSSSISFMKGIVGVVQTLSSLVMLSSNKPSSGSTIGLSPQGINSSLNTGVVPVDPDKFKSFHGCVKEMQDALLKVERVIEDVTTGTTAVVTNKRPVIRIAFKHLAALFEKSTFKCGLMHYICRDGTEDSSGYYNYLHGTYEYYKTLGSLVAEYQGINRDEMVQLEYFNMMSESPTKTLGKIMFHYKADPYKLQKITDSLNIDLTQVVLHNICPAVTYTPSETTLSTVDDNVRVKRIVLNSVVEHQVPSRSSWTRHPNNLVATILCHIIKSLQDHMSNTTYCCTFGTKQLSQYSKTEHCKKLLTQTQLLTSVNMIQLQSNEEKMCFFLNLANLMLIHAALFYAEKSEVDLMSLFGETTETEKIFAQKRILYDIGHLGTVSWYDIQHCILGMKGQSYNKKLHQRNLSVTLNEIQVLDKLDPWSVFGPSYDYRTQYAMVDICSGYYMQVYYPEILKDQLKLAEVDRKDQKDIKCNGFYLSREMWKEKMKPKALLDIQSYTVEYNKLLTESLRNSGLLWKDKGSKTTYKLSDQVNTYLKYKSGLVATLAGLVTKTQPGQISSTSVHVQQQLQNEFPVLHRHLQTLAMHLVTDVDDKISSVPDQIWGLLTDDLGYHFKTIFLSSVQTHQFQQMLKNVFIDLIEQQKWHQLADLVTACPAVIALRSCEQSDLNDLAITACIASIISQNERDTGNTETSKEVEDKNLVWKLICNISDVHLRVRILLRCLVLYNANMAVKYLQSSLTWFSARDLLRVAVVNKIKEMQLYEKISDLAKRELNRLPSSGSQYHSATSNVQYYHNSALDLVDSTDPIYSLEFLQRLVTWKQIRETSITSSDLVLEFLLTCNEHVVAREWVEIFHFYDFTSVIEESCIFFHLEQRDPNVTLVLEILERLTENNSAECKSICINLIPRITHKKYSILLVKFLKKHLQTEMTRDEVTMLYLLHIGCSCLLCLPSHIHCDYDHLIANPILILEQLLMNMKVDLSGKVLDCIKSELDHLRRCLSPEDTMNGAEARRTNEFLSMKIPEESPDEEELVLHLNNEKETKNQLLMHQSQSIASSNSIEIISNPHLLEDLNISIAKCDKLVVEYAKKALEFGILQDMESGRSSVMSQFSPIATPTLQKMRKLSIGPSSVGSAIGIRKMSRVDSSGSINRMGTLLKSAASSVPANLDKRGGSIITGTIMGDPELGAPSVFVMPPEPPTQDQWIPDSSATVCMACGIERFSMFNRRHHCRRCGRVVCSSCSTKTLMFKGTSVRACDQCYEQSHKPKQVLSNKDKAERLRQKFTSHVPDSADSMGSIGSEYTDDTSTIQPLSAEYQYILSEDDEEINDLKREEFYYDHAPSTSLCLSILDLHSDPRQCSQIILDLCDTISMYLQSIGPGIKNPEVDYGLVISMLKYLLFNAKVKSQKTQNSSGVTKCDLYFDRVNLVDILLANNISFIPSIQELTRMDVLRRLRDKLIEEEQWEVATTMSTKCGIDPVGVWVAWGKACVLVGEYKQAREKFSKCLKVPTERNQTQSSSKILHDVIEYLEQSATSVVMGESLLSQLKSVKELLADPITQKSFDHHHDETYFEECVYYLKTYGTFGSLVNFYQRHGEYIKALQVVLKERCSSEVLIENLFLPSLQCGELVRVQDAMVTIDPGMTRWEAYLTAICRYLNKSHMMHSLYHMQLFMKDYIRAAMTCVTYFYQKEAKTYLDLHSRLMYLQDAKSHLESYFEQKMWVGSVEMMPSKLGGRQEPSSTRLIMTPREVNKYIHTIDLQMEVTKYLSIYIDNLKIVLMFASERTSYPAPSSPGPSSGPSTPTRGAGQRQRSSPNLFIKPGELPTLFGSTKMKSELVALVLLSGNNINDGFGLAFRIIQDMKLDSTSIYAQVGTTLTRQHKYNFIRQLLGCMKDSGLCTDHNFDDVIMPCVDMMISDAEQVQEAETFIKLMRSDVNKINSYMRCGKLKSAYLLAVKTQRVEVVQRIEKDALRLNQTAVRSICKKWLQQHGYASLQE